MHKFEDFKVLAINTISLSVSFTTLESTLKLVLLIGSIIYTAQRIVKDYEERKMKKK